MLTNKVSRQLNSMALSTAIGMLSVIGFNLVDTLFIAQLGVAELAAISFTPAIIFSLSSLTIGLGIGLSVVISKEVGADSTLARKNICSYAILLSLLFTVIFALLGVATITPLFTLLGAKAEALEYVDSYMSIWYLSMPLLVLPIVGNSAIRGAGNAKFPAMLMLFSSVSNLILDPIFIFGYAGIEAQGVAGAAWASMIARLAATIIAIYYLYAKADLLSFRAIPVQQILAIWRKLLKIALPVGATRILTPLSMGVVTMIASSHGDEAVAALGVGGRIESVSMIFVTGLSVVIGPFIGQNLGAKQITRVQTAIKYGLLFCLLWGGLNTLLFFLIAEPIGAAFSDEPKVIQLSILYLYIIPVSLIGLATQIIVSSCCHPLGKSNTALKLSVIRMYVFCIPMVMLGNYLYDVVGIFIGLSVANIMTGILSVIILKKVQNDSFAKLTYTNNEAISVR